MGRHTLHHYHQHKLQQERRKVKELPISEYFHGNRSFFDEREQVNVVKIFAGEWYVSKGNEKLVTVLGSCVAACIRDPIINVGGMNHFLLPGDESMDPRISDAARYGVFAMESLINGVLKAGGHHQRLEIKVFGGGNVIKHSARIGSKNAQFIREFLKREGFRIVSEDLEGDHPRRVHYYPDTGKVMMRLLRRQDDLQVVEEEALYEKQIAGHLPEGEIELF